MLTQNEILEAGYHIEKAFQDIRKIELHEEFYLQENEYIQAIKKASAYLLDAVQTLDRQSLVGNKCSCGEIIRPDLTRCHYCDKQFLKGKK